jgi:hypothetical protein
MRRSFYFLKTVSLLLDNWQRLVIRKLLIAIPIILMMISACSPERKLAREFIRNRDSTAVMLLMPSYILKSNLKWWEVEDYDKMNDREKDSALYYNSTFLKEVDDDFLIARFKSSLQSGLMKYNIKPFTEDMLLDFMEVGYRAYKVVLAQVELEEDIFKYHFEDVFFVTGLFYEDFDLNLISMNTWFEITPMNDPLSVNNVLYASGDMMDGIEGRFQNNLFSDDVKFNYNYFPIKTEDIYALTAMLGEKYAGYIYDYMLNEYIHRHFPDGERPKIYFSFDPSTSAVSPAKEERFTFIRP